MGRPEKSIAQNSSVASGFGCRLSGARERAGSPSYRRMPAACGTGYAPLAKAAADYRMPSHRAASRGQCERRSCASTSPA